MKLQRGISRKKNRALVGRTLDVLVEGPSEESELVLVGRHGGQAPEIDGQVFLSGGDARPGEMVRVTITKATDFDLLGELSEADEDDTPAERPRTAGRGASASALVHRASDGRRVTLRTVS